MLYLIIKRVLTIQGFWNKFFPINTHFIDLIISKNLNYLPGNLTEKLYRKVMQYAFN